MRKREWVNWPEGVEMPGTQISRYKREGRLDEAKARRLKLQKEFQLQGFNRADASQKAWEQLPEHFPPLPKEDRRHGDKKKTPGIRLIIANELEQLVKQCAEDEPDPDRDALWAYNHHPIPDLTPKQAPSPAAWHLYEQTRNGSRTIADTVIAGLRAMVQQMKAANKGEGKHRDDGRQVMEVIQKLKAEFGERDTMPA